MAVRPTLAPRATALWERQQPDNPINSLLSSFFDSPGNTDSIATSATTPSTTSTRTTSTTSRRTTSSTSSTPTSTFTPSSTSTTSTSSTPTTTSTTSSSSSSTVVTTSSPTTLVTTSNLVSGTSTSQVVVTTVVTPVVTTTASANRANADRSSSNAGLIGGVVGGVVGGLILLALLIALCCMASRRKSRTGHAYFLCFGERPSRNSAGDLGHSGGAWPTFDPQNDHVSSSYAAGAAGVGAGAAAGAAGAAAAGSRSRRNRRDQANATLPAQFANDDDPERYVSNVGHDAYNDYQGYNAYNSNAYASDGYPDMQERPSRNGAGALAAGAAAGGAASHLYNNASSPGTNRRSSHGHQSYGYHSQQDSYNTANMSPSAESAAPAPWTLPMMGWHDTHGPYSVAGVGQNLANSPPQAQFMVSPSEANAANAAAAAAAARNVPAQSRSPGPDYSHFDPPEVRDARARQAAAAALGSGGGFSRTQSHNKPTSPRRQSRRLSSNHGSPVSQTHGLVGGISPPAYVDAQDELEEVDDQPRRLHLANAEPDLTEDDSSRGGPSRRPAHNHKDPPPSSTYRSNQ